MRLLRENGVDCPEAYGRAALGLLNIGGVATVNMWQRSHTNVVECCMWIKCVNYETPLADYESPDDLVRRWMIPLLLEHAPEVFPVISHELK
jgi:hypothetical protein